MAELDSPILPSKSLTTSLDTPSPITQQSTWFLSNFLYKAIFFSVLIALLPLFPSQAPDPASQSILIRGWELLHLLVVGIAISYGLFSRRNAEHDVEKETPWKADTPRSYVSRILHVSSVFDDDDEPATPSGAFDESKIQTWSSRYYGREPMVMVAEGATINGGDKSNKPLSLPVRRLKSPARNPELLDFRNGLEDESKQSVVLPSPIPWRSRSGRMELKEETGTGMASPPYTLPSSSMEANVSSSLRTPSFRSPVTPSASTTSSPKLLSLSSSPSPESRAKASEDIARKNSFYKAVPPPAPPPPPPSFVHGSLAFSERRNMEKSFKEELKDVSRRGREGLSNGNISSINSLMLETNLRNQIGGPSLGISVRTIRSKELDQDGHFDRATKASSEPSLERMNNENRQPSPLQKSQSEKQNGFVDKVMVETDDSDSDDVAEIIEDLPNSAVDAATDENEVDKKADEFIAKFREQIRLQRIECIKKSTEQRKVRSPE